MHSAFDLLAPFFANLQICSTICSKQRLESALHSFVRGRAADCLPGVFLTYEGVLREYGVALADMPLPLL